MRALRHVAFVVVMSGLGCERGPSVCPEGMRPVGGRSTPGKDAWCKGSGGVSSWVELHTTAPGSKRLSCTFRNGRAEGPFEAWHPGGQPWIRGAYSEGMKVGKWTQWNKDGLKVAEGDYRSGDFVAGAPVGIPAQCEKMKP